MGIWPIGGCIYSSGDVYHVKKLLLSCNSYVHSCETINIIYHPNKEGNTVCMKHREFFFKQKKEGTVCGYLGNLEEAQKGI